MAKTMKKLQKNIKQKKEVKKEEYPLKNQILYFTKIIYIILIVIILLYGLTAIANKEYKFTGNNKINYSTILASQTFNKGNEKYYVAFYDFKNNSDITTAIESITKSKVYKVDLSDKLNNSYIANESNKNVNNNDELKINGVTLIEIFEGKNIDYIEGTENVLSTLKEL